MNRSPLRGLTSPEWVTLIVSLLVVGTMVGVGLREASSRHDRIAGEIQIELQAEDAEYRDGIYYVPYLVTNTGSVAITSAEIWFEVYAGTELVESAEINISSLPLRGTQEGIYVTPLDPNTHEFRGRLETVQFP
jgi:uncharacterized protein (TIGR02588 family)